MTRLLICEECGYNFPPEDLEFGKCLRCNASSELRAAEVLQNKAADLLRRKFPEGTQVLFWVRSGQKIPSQGKVISVNGAGYNAGYVNVRIASGAVRSVHHERII